MCFPFLYITIPHTKVKGRLYSHFKQIFVYSNYAFQLFYLTFKRKNKTIDTEKERSIGRKKIDTAMHENLQKTFD